MKAGISYPRLVFVFLSLTIVSLSITSCHHRRNRSSRSSRSVERIDNRDRKAGDSQSSNRSVIPLEEKGGVFYVTVKINDVPMRFIFDTGASSISISQTEAAFLYKQGTLSETDFQGVENFQDAKGEITQGMVVRLRKVELGNVVLRDIDASIVPNQNAPLLLGQSALQQFGRFSIDNHKKLLILE